MKSQICNVNISLSKQLGVMTAIIVSGQLLNERTNKKIEKVMKKT